ncbi:zinc finger protein 721-like [Mytilus californianus]|uniref:zinc finger protein 721-like n=1 Tax=Mytilus californianus TaxID=6549 RepID=UPI00224633A1|nr:zinc finger protein 721-like [Mytilus californianus]
MMEFSLQGDIVENNDNRSFDEIKVEGEILTWDTLWFEVCSSGEQNEDNKETVNTCSETASSGQLICSTEINNDDASGSFLNKNDDQNIGSKSNEVFAVTTKSAFTEIPEHANDVVTAEVKRRTCTVRDESTGSQLTNKGCATYQDSLENDDTSASVLNKNEDQNIRSKGNDVGATTSKSAKPEHAKDDATAEVQRRTRSVRDDAAWSPLNNKGCSTNQDTSSRTSKQTDITENQIIPNKESKKNKKVSVSDKEAQCKTSEASIKCIQNVNKPDIKSTRKSERGNVEKLFDSTEWDTSTSRVKKKTQIIEKLTITNKSEHIEKRNKENQKDTSQDWPCNELPDSQIVITDNTLHDLLGEIETNIPYQLNEDQFNKKQSTTSNSEHLEDAQIQKTFRLSDDQFNDLNSVTTNNNESGQSDDHDGSENFRPSVFNSGSDSQQVETSYDGNDRICQSARSLYGRKDSAKIINVTPQIKECFVVLKENQYGRTASAKKIDINLQINECNFVLKDTQFGRTDSAKTINVNPQIKECYVVLKDIRKGNELKENTANNQSTALTNRRVVNACNDLNGDQENRNSLRTNDKETKEDKVNKGMKSFSSRLEVNNQKQKGNICKGQKLNKLRNQKFRFPCGKEFKYSCNVCYKKFTKSRHLRKHTRTHTRVITKTQNLKTTHWCFPCGKEFESMSKLKKHQKKHTDDRPYSCNVCCKSFKYSSHLKRHTQIHNTVRTTIQKQKTTHWCFPCGKEYKRMSVLKNHQKMHSDVRPYSCNVCCKKFKNSSHLKQHTPIHTRVRTKIQKQKTTHWCFPCGKEYKRMSVLKNHQKMHSDERPYSCCLCSKKFKRMSHLRMHRRIHTGETPYTCEFCDKKFKYQSSLWLHIPIHKDITERKPFLCSFCGKYFCRKSNFQIHELSHQTERRQSRKDCQDSGKNVDAIRMNYQSIDSQSEFSDTNVLEENFKCSECYAMFEDKDTLKLHEQTHVCLTCLKTLNCVFCAEEFILEKHLIKHLYIHIRENYYHNNASKKDEQKNNTYKKREREQNNGGINIFEVNSNKKYFLNSNEKYTCCQCDEQFCSLALLKTHELTHSMSTPSKSYSNKWKFNCSECNAGFNRMSKLKIHESSHAGVKIQNCDLCGQNFRNKYSLKIHNQIHTGENYFNCDQCDRIYKEASKLRAHRQNDHAGEKTFRCSVCFKRFREKSSLNKHMKHACSQTKVSNGIQCNKDLQFESENSKKQLPFSSNVWMNKEAVPEKIERFVCLHCGTGFHYMAQYKKHLLIHSDIKPFSCDVCDKSFSRKRYLKIHKRIHTGEKPYMCKFCENTFSSTTSLLCHRRTHTGEKPYLCYVCGLQFATAHGLNQHLLMHQDIKLHKCRICYKAFKRLENLESHKETHKQGDKFKCEACRKEFKNIGGLKSHRIYVHSGNKPFSCWICQKRFVKSQGLKKHICIHTGEKPYECNVCQKRFRLQKSLRDHLRVHSGEKPYTCGICGKGFSQSASCTAHQKTHTSYKQYVCEQCGKEFTFKCNYEKHMITHTNERPYSCKVCNKGFTQSSSLNTHYRLHENESNSKKHEEKELSAESQKTKLAHGKVKEIYQRSTSSINSLSSSGTSEGMMSTQKCVKEKGVVAKASNFKTAPKQATRSEGPYPCSTCGKVFTQKYSLNWHQQTHYEKKQFKCDVCGKEFNFKGNLKTHLRVHTNEKPYKCHECGKGFSQTSSLHTHSRLHDKSAA